MLIGGTGGIYRTGTGGSVTGYRESYLHAIAIGDADLGAEPVIQYSASLQVEDSTGAFIDIPDVTYFQVSGNDEGNSTANATIRKVETWGTTQTPYPDLLAPSQRSIRITVTASYSGVSVTTALFVGNITGYTESIGGSGDSINIVAKPLIERIGDSDVTVVTAESKTKYLTLIEACEDKNIPGPVVALVADAEQERNFRYSTVPVLIRVLWGWQNRITAFGGGVVVSGLDDIEPVSIAAITDNNASSETRSLAQRLFNTVRIASLSTGSMLRDTISDAADVAARGALYAPKVLFSREQTLADLEDQAELAIAEQLRGQITAQLRLNPLLEPGSQVQFTGTRMNITGTGRVIRVTHNYSFGQATTTVALRVA